MFRPCVSDCLSSKKGYLWVKVFNKVKTSKFVFLPKQSVIL